jgi:hypothetical protein
MGQQSSSGQQPPAQSQGSQHTPPRSQKPRTKRSRNMSTEEKVAVIGLVGTITVALISYVLGPAISGSLTPTPVTSSAPVNKCPAGWFCFYVDKNWEGRKLQYSDCGIQSLSGGAEGQISSWENTTNSYVKVYDENRNLLWQEGPHSKSSYVGSSKDNKAYSFERICSRPGVKVSSLLKNSIVELFEMAGFIGDV